MKYSFLLIASLALASCVQDEALNREAAVDGVEGANVQLVSIDTETRKSICMFRVRPVTRCRN